MRPLAILFALFAALASYADPFRFEPRAPTSTTGVVLRVDWMWDGCLPRDARVTRDGQKIDVLWSVPKTGACVAAIIPWSDRVALGALEPGKYEVTLRVDSRTGLQTIGTKTIVVADGDPVFEFSPPAISTAGGFVDVQSTILCVQSPADVPKVLVDGVAIQYQVDPCSLVLFMPAHAAGPVDIAVQVGETTYTVKSTFRYLDPHATPDEAVFERVLVPVVWFGPGANGSQWETRGSLRNDAKSSLLWLSDVARPTVCDVGDCRVGPFSTMGLFAWGYRPRGLVLFVPRNIAEDIHFALRVRDTSRGASDLGSEVRVVRERDAQYGRMFLEDVPLDSRYRVTLRLFSIDGGPSDVTVFAVAGDLQNASVVVKIDGVCDAPPCNSPEPGFASFDVRALFPTLAQKEFVALHVQAPVHRPHWALVSVTNNTTQHVTVISPQ